MATPPATDSTTRTTPNDWFFARRQSVAKHGRTDIRSLKRAIHLGEITPDDLVYGPLTGHRWRPVRSVLTFRRPLRIAAQHHPYPLLLLALLVALGASAIWSSRPIIDYLIPPPPPPAPHQPATIPFGVVSNEVEALVATGAFEQAWVTISNAAGSMASGPAGLALLSNRVSRAVLRAQLSEAIGNEQTSTAWQLLDKLDAAGTPRELLDSYVRDIDAIELERATISSYLAALRSPQPNRRQITTAFANGEPYLTQTGAVALATANMRAPRSATPSSALAAAYVYASVGDALLARQALTTFTTRITHDTPTYVTVAASELMLELNAPGQARDLLLQAVTLNDQSYELWIELAARSSTPERAANAIAAISQAINVGGDAAKTIIRTDPRFDPIRSKRSFRKAMK